MFSLQQRFRFIAKSAPSVIAAAIAGSSFVIPLHSQAATLSPAVGPLSGPNRAKGTLFYDETTVQDTCKLSNAQDGRLAVFQGSGNSQTISSFNSGLASISSENPQFAKISAISTATNWKLRVENAQLDSTNGGATNGISRRVRVNEGALQPSVEISGPATGLNNVKVDVEFIRGQGFTAGGVYNAQVTVTCLGS